ncbi:E3 SUMO-protein ligase NSE2 [Varanus komodoensis]|nr:E3 SUMO-protein ligase NSE2 [Varanus komodoensis]
MRALPSTPKEEEGGSRTSALETVTNLRALGKPRRKGLRVFSLTDYSSMFHNKYSLLPLLLHIAVHRQSHSDDIPALEQVDEDIAVTESQMNFICPITQEEMKKPVKNKICGHAYEEAAILELIQHKEQRKKKARCPRVGCNNLHVKKSDLVPDEVLKRAISSQNKQSQSTR